MSTPPVNKSLPTTRLLPMALYMRRSFWDLEGGLWMQVVSHCTYTVHSVYCHARNLLYSYVV